MPRRSCARCCADGALAGGTQAPEIDATESGRIPAEVVAVIRNEYAGLEQQRVNYCRLLNHDSINLTHLREALQKHGLDRYGNKADLIDRLVASDVRPSEVLSSIDRPKLSEMCGYVALKTSGTKQELIDRLIPFYDDLTFEERITKDDREVW